MAAFGESLSEDRLEDVAISLIDDPPVLKEFGSQTSDLVGAFGRRSAAAGQNGDSLAGKSRSPDSSPA